MTEEKTKKWIYKVSAVDNNGTQTTYWYNYIDVDTIKSNEHELVIRMKNGAWYAFNKRFVQTWRHIEVEE
jgi:hypothetical protein